jgi:hypothetical protein
MADVEAMPWPLWMAPARLIGRLRPGLLAAAASDASVLARVAPVIRSALIPLVVIGVAAGFAALHALSTAVEPAFTLNWLRLHMESIYTEVPLFIIVASVIGALSPAAAVLFVLSFGALDLAAAATQPEELHTWALRPFPVVGRLVAYWLLWLLAVEVPVFGRVLALSVRGLAGNRLAVAAMCGAATAGFTLLWAHGAAALIRPVYLWSDIGGPYAQGFVPLQNGGSVFALVAGGCAAVVALIRGPRQLLRLVAPRSDAEAQRRGLASLVLRSARQLIVAALLTIGLGGLIVKPIDAVVVFLAIAGARPLARLLAERSPIGAIMDRLPPVLRVAIAIVLVFPVSFVLIYAPALHSVSEFFSVIVVFALGLFVIELVTAPGSRRSDTRPSLVQAAGVGAFLGLAFLALSGLIPAPALADNGASLQDLWPLFDLAVLGGVGMPVLVWLANKPTPMTFTETPTRHELMRRARHRELGEEEGWGVHD